MLSTYPTLGNRYPLNQRVAIALCFTLCYQPLTKAQIIPDTSLGNENTRVTNNKKITEITGGATRGNNLFHSFKEFSLKNGETGYFLPSGNIQNIFTRVTGKNISNIDGILKVAGSSNLFLLNPNGIVFGKNARLDLKGSFTATTGDRFLFSEGKEYSASDPQPAPLLTVNLSQPIGIKFGKNPASIINQSKSGLNVRPKQTIALLGGDIQLIGGKITTTSGNIELGAVGNNSTINFSPSGINYQGVTSYKDINLTQGARVRVNGSGGKINLTGNNLSFDQQAKISSVNSDNNPGSNINLKAMGDISVSGFKTIINSTTTSTGKGGDITTESNNLAITQGGSVYSMTWGSGSGSDILVSAKNSVTVTDLILNAKGEAIPDDSVFYSFSKLATVVFPRALGTGGNLTIESKKVNISNSGRIFTITYGSGKGGDLTINATDSVKVQGFKIDSFQIPFPSALLAKTEFFNNYSPDGNAGNMTINTGQLIISSGAYVSNSSLSRGASGNFQVTANLVKVDGAVNIVDVIYFPSIVESDVINIFSRKNPGNLIINTSKFIVSGGGYISASNYGIGKQSGTLEINASDYVKISGKKIDVDTLLEPGLFTKTESTRSNGGNLIINTPKLIVTDYAKISAEAASSSGRGGAININAQNITLNNYAKISTTSKLGNGGGITISNNSLLFLRRNSNIQTNSGSRKSRGDGGNININSQFIISNPPENANISANAFIGAGGQINIRATSLFGIYPALFPTSISDITTFSQSGTPGVTVINTPNIQPNTQPVNFISAPIAIKFVRLCEQKQEQLSLSLYNYGRGGVKWQTSDLLNRDGLINPWLDLISPDNQSQTQPEITSDSVSLYLPCQ